MTDTTPNLYIQFTETNGWEGETWHRYIPIAGNEAAIERLRQLIDDEDADEDEDDFGEGFSIHPDTLTGEQVDTLVKYANDDNTSYAGAHEKLVGTLDLDGPLSKKAVENREDLYKLKIAYYMRSSDSSTAK
jgi:hypothetical protein